MRCLVCHESMRTPRGETKKQQKCAYCRGVKRTQRLGKTSRYESQHRSNLLEPGTLQPTS